MLTHSRPMVRRTAGTAACLALVLASTPATAQIDRMYFPAVDNVTNVLVQHINAETVRIDMSAWYLTEHAISIALLNRFRAGVQVRLIGDRGSIFEIDPRTKDEFYWLASQGVPIRLRVNPTWYPEIAHWKCTIFVGQNLVEFGSANYTPFQLAPSSSTNYSDETAWLTSDAAIVGAFKTKFDQVWNDATVEPQSVFGGPPYLRNWNDACAAESACSDYWSRYPNRTPMSINTARLEPNRDPLPNLIWGQGPELNNRMVQDINNEGSRVDIVIYRLTVDNITQALLGRFQAGVPVRVIMEPGEYLNRKWPEFWITHANIDKLWAAGVPIKQRQHQGITHMKTLITSAYASSGSSNFAAAWQRDHNYFVSSSSRPTIYQALRNRFQAMWSDTAGFTDFVPQPPDAPGLSAPSNGTGGVSTRPTLTWQRATFAVSFDVYLGTSPSSLARVATVPARLVNNPPTTYSWTPGSSLATGTTYYWRIVSRTNATPRNPNLVASSSTWSFQTSGTPSTPPPSSPLPTGWSSQDIGAVGAAGGASYSNGQFSVRGAGADIWGTADAFRFAYRTLAGDGQIVARVTSLQNTDAFAKAGVMIRQGLSAGSAHVILDTRPGGSVEFMARPSSGAATSYLAGTSRSMPTWLRLSRSGSTITGAVSADGSGWTTVGATSVAMSGTIYVGMAVTSHTTSTTATGTFDNVTVGSVAAPPPSTAPDVVIYASDVPAGGIHGSWSAVSGSVSPNGVKLASTNLGWSSTAAPLANPTDYVDVQFDAVAGTPYRIWLRMQALNNDKLNDAVWVQFSGAQAYGIGTSSGLLVNLATDGTATSLSGWGWQNTAYWLSQQTTVTFSTSGPHTIRIQVREDGVQFDQIVLSPSRFMSSPPGGPTNDATIVAK